MRKAELERLEKEAREIRNSTLLTKDEKILHAVNLMPHIRNKNVRKAYATILGVIYEELM